MEEKSKAYVNAEGFIQIDYATHLNMANQGDMQERVLQLAANFEDKNIPLKIMTNLAAVVSFDAHAQGLAHRAVAGLNIIKTAAFGASPEIQKIHSSLYAEGDKADRIQYFTTREEALAWLRM